MAALSSSSFLLFFVCTETPKTAVTRTLILITKTIQNVANRVKYGTKEQYMTPMNSFVTSNIKRVEEFLVNFAVGLAVVSFFVCFSCFVYL